jgi:hypothetical protein
MVTLRDAETILQGHAYVLNNTSNLYRIQSVYEQISELQSALMSRPPSAGRDKLVAQTEALMDRAMEEIVGKSRIREESSDASSSSDSANACLAGFTYAAAICALGAYCGLALLRIPQVMASM